MPRACSVCTHAARAAIDAALADATPNRRIAAHYGLSEAAVRRHRADHVPATIARAAEAQEVARADSLLDQVQALKGRALGLLDQAEAGVARVIGRGKSARVVTVPDLRAAIAAIREVRGVLELVGKLTGALREQAEVRVTLEDLVAGAAAPPAEDPETSGG